MNLIDPERQDGRTYQKTQDLQVLQEHIGCMVRVKRSLKGRPTQYYLGGILTAVEPAFVRLRSLVKPGVRFSMQTPGLTFYMLSKAPNELDTWTAFANDTFGSDTIKVNKLPS